MRTGNCALRMAVAYENKLDSNAREEYSNIVPSCVKEVKDDGTHFP